MWGTVGILYNADKARAILGDTPITSLDVVLNKATAAKFAKCGISVLDSWQDIMPLVARYLGQPQLSDDPAKLDAVVAKLSEIKPMLRRIASSGYYEQLADGELCLALGLLRRRHGRAAHGPGGQHPCPDRLCLWPRDGAPVRRQHGHPGRFAQRLGRLSVHQFHDAPGDFRRGDPVHRICVGERGCHSLLEPSVRDNAVVYPPAAVRERLELERVYTPDELRAFNRRGSGSSRAVNR